MGPKKNFNYYAMIFGIATLAILIYTGITWAGSGTLDKGMLTLAFVLPLLFTGFLFVFDKIFGFIFKKTKKEQEEKHSFEAFVVECNEVLNKEGNYSIQDYRELQDSEKFQKTLRQLFTVKTSGETTDLTYDYLGRKFKKSTIEYSAVEIIINELKKMD